MRMTNRRLKKLMQNNPIRVEPKRKRETADYAANYTEKWKKQEKKEERIMRKNWKLILVTAAIVLSLTVIISAAVISYYYRTPKGDIIDEAGNIVKNTAGVDSIVNDSAVSGEGYHIASVTWTMVDNRTTLAVWVSNDSMELTGLTAVTEDGEYPLPQSTFNLTGGYVGYTTTDIAKPTVFTLKCDTPAFERQITFQPEDVIPAESTSNGLTLFGTTEGSTVYIGVNDNNFLDSELFKDAALAFVKTSLETVTDNEGNEYTDGTGGTNRDDTLSTRQHYEIPEGNRIVSVKTERIKTIYSFGEAANLGYAPSVSVPVPDDGETLTGDWALIDTEGFRYIINSVRRTGETLTFTTDEGLTYDGVYSIDTVMPSTYVYTGVNGYGMPSGGGSNEEWTFEFEEGKLENVINETGEIDVCVFEIGLCYAGEWELVFE